VWFATGVVVQMVDPAKLARQGTEVELRVPGAIAYATSLQQGPFSVNDV
jgi:hypothetical protein